MPPPDPLVSKGKPALSPGTPPCPPSDEDRPADSILRSLTLARATEAARKGNLEQAADLLSEFVQGERPSAESLDLMARIRVQQGKPTEAAELWGRLLRLFPAHEGARAALDRLSRRTGSLRGLFPPASTVLGVLAFLSLAVLGVWILSRLSHSRRQLGAEIAQGRDDGRKTSTELKALISGSTRETSQKLESLGSGVEELRKDASRALEERRSRDTDHEESLKAIQDALGRLRQETESIRKRVETTPPTPILLTPPAPRGASAPLIVDRFEFPKVVLYSADDSASVGFDHPWSDPPNLSVDGAASFALMALAKSVPPNCPSIVVLLICPSDENPDQVLRRGEVLLKDLVALTGLSPKTFSLSLKHTSEPGYGAHPLLIRVMRAAH